MKHSIREFRDSGQLFRHAIVEDGVIVEMHVFDEAGNEISNVSPKGWRIGKKGELIPDKKASTDPTTVGHRNSLSNIGNELVEEDREQASISRNSDSEINARVDRMRQEIAHLTERLQYIESIASSCYPSNSKEHIMSDMNRIEEIANQTLRRIYHEDR